jgi:uncharacterized membrane protein YeaQ/YmgE (transglycosylase-associated protein family)
MAGFLGFILLGLIAGAVAKLTLPKRQGRTWIATLLLGVAGALLAGWLGRLLFGSGNDGFFDIASWIAAIVGAVIVLVVWGLLTRNGRKA